MLQKNNLRIVFFICILAFPSVSHADTTTGLVGYWTFDGKDTPWTSPTAGTTKDRSGNGNTGTLTNMSQATSTALGKIGQALKFDGVDDQVLVSSDVIGSGAASICTWIKVRSMGGGGYGRIVMSMNGATEKTSLLMSYPAPLIAFSSNASTFISTSAISYNQWTHVCATRDASGNGVIYLNGVSNVTGATGTPSSGGTVTRIGNTNDGSRAFDGLIDDVRIYNRALSAADITQLYKQGASKYATSPTLSLTSGLVGYWTLDGKDTPWTSPTAGTTKDRSGNGNTGTLTNMTRSVSTTLGKIGQALKFDGVDDYVSLGINTFNSLTNNYTLSAWVIPSIASGGENVWSTSGGRTSIGMSSGKALFHFYTGAANVDVIGTSILPVGKPSLITTVKSSSAGVSVYVNGVLETTDASKTTDNVPYPGDYASIGLTYFSGGYYNMFAGSIDDVRIYNRALSASEITQLYKSGKVVYKVCPTNTVKDTDGNVYGTMAIGSQCWMKQNMRVGTRIAVSGNQTNNSIIEKYCYSDTDANCTSNNPNQPDGGLYQWDEAMQYVTTAGARGICPAGWHIPTDGEQYTLENYLKDNGQTCNASRSGSYDCDTAGTKLKPNGSSGFEGNLAGYVLAGSFFSRGTFGYFWSSSESGASAFYRTLFSANSKVNRLASTKSYGFSVRCLKN